MSQHKPNTKSFTKVVFAARLFDNALHFIVVCVVVSVSCVCTKCEKAKQLKNYT